MADTKITALAAITTVDPAADVLPIVDVSDTSMAASGTTKKITSNQILGAGGTATLASATITGDLTVNTNVNVGASPAFYGGKIATNGSIAISGGNYLKLWNSTGTGVGVINAAAADTLTFSLTNAFTTAMTLNSNGLGLGVAPSAKLDVQTSAGRFKVANYGGASVKVSSSGAMGYEVSAGNGHQFFIDVTQAMTLDSSGRLLVGTASAPSGGAVQSVLSNSSGAGIQLHNATGVNGGMISSVGGSGLIFYGYTGAVGSETYTERARIDNAGNLILQSSATPATLTVNGQLTVNATSNTNLRFSYRGSDGVTRTANITLA